jgi:hypothetical protein
MRTISLNGSGYYFKYITLRWHEIFDRFRFGLPHLQHFATHASDRDWTNDAFDYRYDLTNRLDFNKYHIFDCGLGPSPWQEPSEYGPGHEYHDFYLRGAHPHSERLYVEFPRCDEEDTEALVCLMKAVNSRTSLAV